MLAIKRLPVTPEVNLRECVTHTPPPSMNKETLPEVQNRVISGPTKRNHVLQKLKKTKKTRIHSSGMRTDCCSGQREDPRGQTETRENSTFSCD